MFTIVFMPYLQELGSHNRDVHFRVFNTNRDSRLLYLDQSYGKNQHR